MYSLCLLVSVLALASSEQRVDRASELTSTDLSFTIPLHGNWCGPGHPKDAVLQQSKDTWPSVKDELDQICKTHDLCYGTKQHDGDVAYWDCVCNREMVEATRKLKCGKRCTVKAAVFGEWFNHLPCKCNHYVRGGGNKKVRNKFMWSHKNCLKKPGRGRQYRPKVPSTAFCAVIKLVPGAKDFFRKLLNAKQKMSLIETGSQTTGSSRRRRRKSKSRRRRKGKDKGTPLQASRRSKKRRKRTPRKRSSSGGSNSADAIFAKCENMKVSPKSIGKKVLTKVKSIFRRM